MSVFKRDTGQRIIGVWGTADQSKYLHQQDKFFQRAHCFSIYTCNYVPTKNEGLIIESTCEISSGVRSGCQWISGFWLQFNPTRITYLDLLWYLEIMVTQRIDSLNFSRLLSSLKVIQGERDQVTFSERRKRLKFRLHTEKNIVIILSIKTMRKPVNNAEY